MINCSSVPLAIISTTIFICLRFYFITFVIVIAEIQTVNWLKQFLICFKFLKV